MDREYPDQPIVGVGAVIFRGDDVLLIKRAKPPKQGHWSLPGGAQEAGETAQDALIREVTEETGVEIAIGGFIAVVDLIERDEKGRARRHYTLLDYWAEWLTGDLTAGSDADDAVWAAAADLDDYHLWSKTLEVISEARELRELRARQAGKPAAPAARPQKISIFRALRPIGAPHTAKGHLRAFGIAALFGLAAYVAMMALIFFTRWIGMGG